MLMSTLKPALSGVEQSSGIHMKRCGVEGSSFSKYGQFNTLCASLELEMETDLPHRASSNSSQALANDSA
jgi:hypothetical protein